MKTCCFTGRRRLTQEQVIKAAHDLSWTIDDLIKNGYTHFISGVADGIDLLAARIVLEFRKSNKNLSLQAAVPYRNRLNSHDGYFQYIIKSCSKITVTSEQYNQGCFSKRNKFMVDNSDLVVAVWDGVKSGGTYNTIMYAKSQGKQVITIDI